MKILNISDFNPKWLRTRFLVCSLPPEFVSHCRYTSEPLIFQPDLCYGYKLPSENFPPKEIKTETSHSFHYQVAIEVHEDYGSDGHVEYCFQDKFIILYDNEIPKNLKGYRDLIEKFYTWEWEKDRQKELKESILEKRKPLTI